MPILDFFYRMRANRAKNYCVWAQNCCNTLLLYIFRLFFTKCHVFRLLQYELVKDSKAVNSVRELLIIIRFWGLVRNSCLPIFISSAENVDVLGLLFKLLSRLVQSSEPDDGLIGM